MSSMTRTIRRAIKRNGVQQSPKAIMWLARQNGKTNNDDYDIYKKQKMDRNDIVK